jgi:hypothetical protein
MVSWRFDSARPLHNSRITWQREVGMKLIRAKRKDEDADDYWVKVVTQLRRDFGCFYLGQPLTQQKFSEIIGCGVASVVRWETQGRRPPKNYRLLLRFLVYNRDLQERWWNAHCNYNETTDWLESIRQTHRDMHPRLEMLVEGDE